MAGSPFRFGLAFDLVECERCHGARPAEAPCHCGSRVLYVDAALDRRRAIVARVRPILDRPGPSVQRTAGEIMHALSSWSDGLLDSVRSVGTDGDREAERSLAAQLTRFRDIAASVRASTGAPDRSGVWAALTGAVVALRGSVDAYLDALSATSPEDAARYGEQAQRGLDAAGAIMSAFAARADQGNEQAPKEKRGLLRWFLLGAAAGGVARRT